MEIGARKNGKREGSTDGCEEVPKEVYSFLLHRSLTVSVSTWVNHLFPSSPLRPVLLPPFFPPSLPCIPFNSFAFPHAKRTGGADTGWFTAPASPVKILSPPTLILQQFLSSHFDDTTPCVFDLAHAVVLSLCVGLIDFAGQLWSHNWIVFCSISSS